MAYQLNTKTHLLPDGFENNIKHHVWSVYYGGQCIFFNVFIIGTWLAPLTHKKYTHVENNETFILGSF